MKPIMSVTKRLLLLKYKRMKYNTITAAPI